MRKSIVGHMNSISGTYRSAIIGAPSHGLRCCSVLTAQTHNHAVVWVGKTMDAVHFSSVDVESRHTPVQGHHQSIDVLPSPRTPTHAARRRLVWSPPRCPGDQLTVTSHQADPDLGAPPLSDADLPPDAHLTLAEAAS